jgi:hypothetical protein
MSVEEHCAAMAAEMIDEEIAWIARRLPENKRERTRFHSAVKKEAERRGIQH